MRRGGVGAAGGPRRAARQTFFFDDYGIPAGALSAEDYASIQRALEATGRIPVCEDEQEDSAETVTKRARRC